ncbi:MAG: hypothetical protein FJ320_02225 [SAR202 cluster bacterium]|nr:hypothetical protein [SAR202 cluster bacterium]
MATAFKIPRPAALVLQEKEADSSGPLIDRWFELLTPLTQSKTRGELHGAVEEAIVAFIPFNQITMRAETFQIAVEATQESGDYQVKEAVFNSLVKGAIRLLSTKDLVTLNKALRTRDDFNTMIRELAPTDRASSMSLYLDRFWGLQKIELLISALIFVASGDLKPRSKSLVRWVCSEIQGHAKGLETAIASKTPALGVAS